MNRSFGTDQPAIPVQQTSRATEAFRADWAALLTGLPWSRLGYGVSAFDDNPAVRPTIGGIRRIAYGHSRSEWTRKISAPSNPNPLIS